MLFSLEKEWHFFTWKTRDKKPCLWFDIKEILGTFPFVDCVIHKQSEEKRGNKEREGERKKEEQERYQANTFKIYLGKTKANETCLGLTIETHLRAWKLYQIKCKLITKEKEPSLTIPNKYIWKPLFSLYYEIHKESKERRQREKREKTKTKKEREEKKQEKKKERRKRQRERSPKIKRRQEKNKTKKGKEKREKRKREDKEKVRGLFLLRHNENTEGWSKESRESSLKQSRN